MTATDPPVPELPTPRGVRRVGIDKTLDQVRSMILSGELAPGTSISQLKLAERLGVSTTPLREAMRQLQAEGLLEAELNRRSRVPSLDIDNLHAIYATRILMESLAIMLTVDGIRDQDVAMLHGDLSRMRELSVKSDLRTWEEVHTSFHHRLVSGATSAMAPALSSVFDRSERFRRLSLLRDQPRGWSVGQEEHERIVAACADRNGAGAAHELATHLARTAIGLSAAFAPEVDPAPIRFAVALVATSRSEAIRSGRLGG